MAKKKGPVMLDIDEMINHPSMKGMLSFLEISPEEKRLRLAERDRLQSASLQNVPSDTYPNSSVGSMSLGMGTPIEPASSIILPFPSSKAYPPEGDDKTGVTDQNLASSIDSMAKGYIGNSSIPNKFIPISSIPNLEQPALPPLDSLGLPKAENDLSADPFNPSASVQFGKTANTRRRPFQPKRVQDAHTPGEDKVWNELRALARIPRYGRSGPDYDSYCWASQPTIAYRVGMHENNVRHILRSLQGKKSIELVDNTVDRAAGRGRTWRIPPFDTILENRRRAGLIWAIRGNSIRFINVAEYKRLSQAEDSSVPNDYVGSGEVSRQNYEPSDSVGPVDTKLLGTKGTKLSPSKEIIINSTEHNTSATAPATFQALALKAIDDAGADIGLDFMNRVWAQATTACPDITRTKQPILLDNFGSAL